MRRFIAAACLATSLLGQVIAPGPQVVTFLSAVDDTDQPYGLYVPKTFDAKKKYPLVISLHGAGSNHRLNLRRVFGQGNRIGETDAEATRYFPVLKDVDFIVATPLARGTMGYQGIAEKDVYAVLDDVKKRFAIDEDRIYLTGLSMGGGGTLWLGLTRPDIWAAIAPVCPYPPPGTDDLAGNALNLPVKMFQGEIDPIVKAADTRAWQQRFEQAGVASDYVEYKGVRHNSWDNAYRGAAIFDWFARQKRVRFPNRVRYASRSYEYPGAYWVRFDRLTPGTLASIDAAFSGKNKLVVKTSQLDAFTLLLKGHPMFSAVSPLSIVVDGTTVRTKNKDSVALSRTARGWQARSSAPGPKEKRKGLEGPIAAAVADRHIYVYGTSDSPGPEELEFRRHTAARAAEWSTPRSRLLLTFRVMADKDVREAELKSENLVLFGTKETNSVIAKLAPNLPVSLHPGAADYGLVYVYPSGSRYVLINSGLPWWMRAEEVTRPSMVLAPPLLRTLMTFEDFILFKGGLENVIIEGRFDRNWKLPTPAAARLRETGAVEVAQ